MHPVGYHEARRLDVLMRAILVASFGVLAVGCGGGARLTTKLKEAASADLQCPKSQVFISKTGKTRDVEACGKSATYKWDGDDWRMVSNGAPPGQPVMKSGPPQGAPPQVAPVNQTPTGTPSQPPPNMPPPGNKNI